MREIRPSSPHSLIDAPPLLSLLSASAIQRAKSILADNRDSLVLWNAYARLERQRGKVAEARKVYLRALSLSSPDVQKASAAADGETWALFKGWAELEWSEWRDAHAVAVIAAAASGDFSDLGNVSFAFVLGRLLRSLLMTAGF